jgi:23S rRNA (cytidine1920-2'-O)/16S rRNA (cytidine1409-2'-O)-methyltransferase
MKNFVSRAGEKLQFALDSFKISIKDKIWAKLVYAVDTCYGELAWKLRNDRRVVVLERTNAMHVKLPELVDFISIDVGWTKQALILPNALANLKEGGQIISLIKPHYEAEKWQIQKGKLADKFIDEVLTKVRHDIESVDGKVMGLVESPILGAKGQNREFLALLTFRQGELRNLHSSSIYGLNLVSS